MIRHFWPKFYIYVKNIFWRKYFQKMQNQITRTSLQLRLGQYLLKGFFSIIIYTRVLAIPCDFLSECLKIIIHVDIFNF